MSSFPPIVAAIAVIGIVVIALALVFSRRSHLRSWRIGVFYESEEHVRDPNHAEEGDEQAPPD